jgi:1-deoxy-D-xylulose-5-phosphate reductoisomerase
MTVRLRDTQTKVSSGMAGLIEAATLDETDTVVTAVVGTVGLVPTLAAIEKGKRIALANKETLVCAGAHVMRTARAFGSEILPVDSEHSAIFQCRGGSKEKAFKKILLTASGGPFRGKSPKELGKVTYRDALSHPNWQMGKKITVDSSTLMNKGLEFIEAMHLYNAPPDKIKILIHPQSIIHPWWSLMTIPSSRSCPRPTCATHSVRADISRTAAIPDRSAEPRTDRRSDFRGA